MGKLTISLPLSSNLPKLHPHRFPEPGLVAGFKLHRSDHLQQLEVRSETVGLEAVKHRARRAPLDTSTHIDIDIDVDVDVDVDVHVHVHVRVYIYNHYIMHIDDITGMLCLSSLFPSFGCGVSTANSPYLEHVLEKVGFEKR